MSGYFQQSECERVAKVALSIAPLHGEGVPIEPEQTPSRWLLCLRPHLFGNLSQIVNAPDDLRKRCSENSDCLRELFWCVHTERVSPLHAA